MTAPTAHAHPPARFALRALALVAAVALAIALPLALSSTAAPTAAARDVAAQETAQETTREMIDSGDDPSAIAAESDPAALVNDHSATFTGGEVAELEERARAIESKYGMSPLIIFYRVQSTSYDQHDWLVEYLEAIGRGSGTGRGALVFAVAAQSRDVTVMSVGPGEQVAGVWGTDQIREDLVVPLGDDRWFDAASLFLDESDLYLAAWQAGTPYSEENPRHPESLTSKILKWGGTGVAGAAGGGAAGGGLMWWLVRKNRTARRRADADDYLGGPPSMRVSDDIFLYSTTSTRTISSESSSSSGSSSRSGGGYTSSSSKF